METVPLELLELLEQLLLLVVDSQRVLHQKGNAVSWFVVRLRRLLLPRPPTHPVRSHRCTQWPLFDTETVACGVVGDS